MGYVAPAIIQAWGVDKASLGPVLGAVTRRVAIGQRSRQIGWPTGSVAARC